MRRRFPLVVLVLSLACLVIAAESGDEVPPLLFELSINGETFLIEPNREFDLKSKDRPGTTYKVAMRLARKQKWLMNTVGFEYDGGFTVEDDNESAQRTAHLTHDLGFSLVVIDLGAAPEAADRGKVLETLVESMAKRYRDRATDITVGKPVDRRYLTSSGQEVMIQYTDENKKKMTARIFLLVSGPYAAGCILQYPTADEADIAPIARTTLDSIVNREDPRKPTPTKQESGKPKAGKK